MEYKKIISLMDYTNDQPSKFITKKLIVGNVNARGTNSIDTQIKFKATMLTSSLCGNRDAYILGKEIITITTTGADEATQRADEVIIVVII